MRWNGKQRDEGGPPTSGLRADRGDLISERALSKRWGVSQRTLQRWRAETRGPAWVRIGGVIRYAFGDILDHEAAGRSGGEE